MKRHRLMISLLALITALVALLPIASSADDPAPPPRAWDERRHPEVALEALEALPAQPSAAEAASAPGLFPYEQWSRVAFQSKRDGDWEIYFAYPNGNGAERLTYSPTQDLRPRLDAEARRVVWVSDRNGTTDIYTVNINSSEVRLLTGTYAADDDPVWSPDGAAIAFSSDRAGDWDVYTMNADGSGVTRVTNLPGDDWGPTWSPDGKELAWIHVDGEHGTIFSMRLDGGTPDIWAQDLLMPAHLVWAPDGEYIGYDALPANPGWSAVYRVRRGASPELLLAAASGDVWMNSWSPDGAGFIVTDVRRNAQGSSYWLSLSQRRLTGEPGDAWHSLHIDAFADWKSLDTRPPVTYLAPLPGFSRDRVTLKWLGADQGSAGLEYYEIERRVNTGPAQLTRVGNSHSATFTGQPGETHTFRLRGVDGAGNVESWGNAAQTTFDKWIIFGRATGVRGNALAGVSPVISGATTLAQTPSSETEPYHAHVVAPNDELDVAWRREPYLALPATRFSARSDAQFDVVLPSPDNLLTNWGFEEADLAGWRKEGAWPPVVSTATIYTGRQAAAFGGGESLLTAPKSLAPALAEPSISVGVDALGRAYFAIGGDRDATPGPIYLSIVGADGALQVTEQLNREQPYGLRPTVVVAADGTVDVVWVQDDLTSYAYELWHRRRDPSGAWSAPYVTSLPDYFTPIAVANDGMGNLHILTAETRGTDRHLVYLRRTAAGAWDTPVELGENVECVGIAVDVAGRVHAAWNYGTKTFYRLRDANSMWGPTETAANGMHSDGYFDLTVDRNGQPHLLRVDSWIKAWTVHHVYRAANGEWQATYLDDKGAGIPRIRIDELGVIHGVWSRPDGIAYWQQAPDEAPTSRFILGPGQNTSPALAVGGGVAYVAWLDWTNGASPLHVRQATAAGWGNDYSIARVSSYRMLALALGAEGRPLIAWFDGEARYMQPAVAARTGSSSLSRDILVPHALAAPTLSLMARIEKPWADPRGRFEVRLRDRNYQTTVLGALEAERAGWRHLWYDLTAWQGQEVMIELAVAQEAGGPPLNVYLDEVTLGSGLHTDTWARPALWAIPPGQAGQLTLQYGNRGDFGATGVVLRLTLPAGVTLVSAHPPGLGSGPTIEWTFTELSADSEGAVEITLLNEKTNDDPSRLTVAITPGPGEVETENNTASAWVWGHTSVLLPITGR